MLDLAQIWLRLPRRNRRDQSSIMSSSASTISHPSIWSRATHKCRGWPSFLSTTSNNSAADPTKPSPEALATLQTLPPELLLQISDFLTPSNRLSLKLTSRALYQQIPSLTRSAFKNAPVCDRTAFTRILDELQLARRNQRRCLLCAGVQADDFFIPGLPVCKRHEAWLRFRCVLVLRKMGVRSEVCARSRRHRGESGNPRLWYCAHERNVVSSDEDGVAECFCACETCGHFAVCFDCLAGG